MIGVHEQQHALACMEVWGGNRSVTRTVELPDLTLARAESRDVTHEVALLQ